MAALSNYKVNFTDPLTGEFVVSPFTTDGSIFPTIFSPLDATAISANTSLLIYGKGSPNYGERIQENIIHLLENFYGATEPVHAVSGQLWFTSVHYWFDSVGAAFYQFNDPTQTWLLITVISSPTPPLSPNDGDYWFEPGSSTLSIWNADFNTWQPRLYTTRTTAPVNGADFPDKQLLVCHNKNLAGSQAGGGFTARWKKVGGITASPIPPSSPQTGDLWFDTIIPQLKIFDGATFISVADRYLLLDGSVPMMGDLTLFGSPTAPLHAATKAYVDALDSTDIANVSTVSGVSVTDALDDIDISLTGIMTSLANKIDLSGANTPMTGFLTLSADPVNPLHAATKAYVDAAVLSGGADGTVISGVLNPNPPGADLQLNLTVGGPIIIPGFAPASHDHTAFDTPFTPISGIVATNVQDAIEELNTVTTRMPFNKVKRNVVTTTGVATYISVPSYFISTDTLWVYLNGIKQVAGGRGQQAVLLDNVFDTDLTGLSDPIVGVVTGLAGFGSFDVTGDRTLIYTAAVSIVVLGSFANDGTYTVSVGGSTYNGISDKTTIPVNEAVSDPTVSGELAATYTATVAVDGGAAQPLIFNGTVVSTCGSLAAMIDATLVGANPILNRFDLTIVSDTTSPLSSILITDGVSPYGLFGALIDFLAIASAIAGFGGAYQEDGPAGLTASTSITFTPAPAAANTLEFLVFTGV